MSGVAAAVERLADILEQDRVDRERDRRDGEARRRAEDPELTAELVAVRRPLRPLGPLLLPKVLHAGGPGTFETVVPAHYWTADADRETAELACPCGVKPQLPAWQIRVCECGRGYIYDGRQVRIDRPRNGSPEKRHPIVD